MIVAETPQDARNWARSAQRAGHSLGLVPTMGALHAGHFSLIDRARSECSRVAVSIFVNPTQFGPNEDLTRYPRTVEEDVKGCRERGVDLVLLPPAGGEAGIYPPGFQTWVEVRDLAAPLCGDRRPGHFRGVTTVVAILFGIFRPDRAYFGQKDFQQARVIERMALDLRLDTRVVVLPIVREADGLALSSRNRFLSPEERERALAIPRALQEAETLWRAGEERVSVLEALVLDRLGPASGLTFDYARILDASTLEPLACERIDAAPQGAVLAVAAYAGSTRLIDNVRLGRGGAPENRGG